MPPDPPRRRTLCAVTPQPHPTFWWLSAPPLLTHVWNLPPRSPNPSYAPGQACSWSSWNCFSCRTAFRPHADLHLSPSLSTGRSSQGCGNLSIEAATDLLPPLANEVCSLTLREESRPLSPLRSLFMWRWPVSTGWYSLPLPCFLRCFALWAGLWADADLLLSLSATVLQLMALRLIESRYEHTWP